MNAWIQPTLAVDIAMLLPPDVQARALALSAALPREEFQGLRLDEQHLPHITLMQLFVRTAEIEQAAARVDEVVRGHARMTLQVTGGGRGTHAVWMAVARAPALVSLHEQLMDTLRGLERPDGGPSAFADPDARLRDVLWVSGYRLSSSFHHFTPHITLGHAAAAPTLEPFAFEADTVAMCHLGRFCTCRRVLRRWTLSASGLP